MGVEEGEIGNESGSERASEGGREVEVAAGVGGRGAEKEIE